MSHFRTLTVVVEVADDSDLRHPGGAAKSACEALEAAGFTLVAFSNAPNPDGKMPELRTAGGTR